MLYLHGGWVRTGTSSLQAALVAHQGELATGGVVYPDQWRLPGRDNHHRIIELLADEDGDQRSRLEGFQRHLGSLSRDAVLLSSESLTYWLGQGNRDALLNLVAAAQEVMPVTCIWTLRDIADIVHSMYLRQILGGSEVAPPTRFIRHFANAADRWEDSFAGLCRLERAVDNTVYLKYESNGSHNEAILRAVGAPLAVSTSIKEQLDENPPLNASLSHKAAVTMIHLDAVSARAGLPMHRATLRELFFRGEFRFEDDRPCKLVDDSLMREVREQALSAAQNCGFTPYLEFFGNRRIENSPPVDIEPEVLSDNDLKRLAACLCAQAG